MAMKPHHPVNGSELDIREFALAKLVIPCKHTNSDAAFRRGAKPHIDITRFSFAREMLICMHVPESSLTSVSCQGYGSNHKKYFTEDDSARI
jgi:hypothetical protein